MDDPGYGDLVNRVKHTFKNEDPNIQVQDSIQTTQGGMLAALGRNVTKKLSMRLSRKSRGEVHPEPQQPEPEPVVPKTQFKVTKASPTNLPLLSFVSESEFHLALKRFDYSTELEQMIFEELENDDFEKELDAIFDVNSVLSENLEDVILPPELYKSLMLPISDSNDSVSSDIKPPEFFSRIRSQKASRRETFIRGTLPDQVQLKSTNVPGTLPVKEKSSFAWAFASGINAGNWSEYTSQWRKASAVSKLPKPNFNNNVLVPDGPKEFIDPAIVFAEKQMEAWEQMKNDMLHRNGLSKQNRFHYFSDVIDVVRGLRQLGMSPNLLVLFIDLEPR
jgi:hypothetical protein